MTKYPMKRFPDEADDYPGVFSMEAREYGVGAFCWRETAEGLCIVFRHPDKIFKDSDGNPVHVTAIPVDTVPKRWDWNGDKDRPTLSPSIVVRFKQKGEWVESFHGFIRDGVLEVL